MRFVKFETHVQAIVSKHPIRGRRGHCSEPRAKYRATMRGWAWLAASSELDRGLIAAPRPRPPVSARPWGWRPHGEWSAAPRERILVVDVTGSTAMRRHSEPIICTLRKVISAGAPTVSSSHCITLGLMARSTPELCFVRMFDRSS